MTEKELLQLVRDLARLAGWKEFHPYLSVRSTPGYPDLTLAKAGEPILFAELKGDAGKLTRAQEDWLTVLREAQGTEVYVWRPSDFSTIEARLLRKRTR